MRASAWACCSCLGPWPLDHARVQITRRLQTNRCGSPLDDPPPIQTPPPSTTPPTGTTLEDAPPPLLKNELCALLRSRFSASDPVSFTNLVNSPRSFTNNSAGCAFSKTAPSLITIT